MPVITSWSRNTSASFMSGRGGPRYGPPHPPAGSERPGGAVALLDVRFRGRPLALGAPRGTRGAPRPLAYSSDTSGRRLADVEPVDHVAVLAEDGRAPHLVGPRQLVVVGVQLLVEQREGVDPGRRAQVLVHPRHFPADQREHLGLAGEVLERGERHPVALRPVADGAHVDL